MGEQRANAGSDREENPLQDLADDLSAGLTGQPVNVKGATVNRIEGGQVWMKESAARTVNASALQLENSAAAWAQSGSLDIHDSVVAVVGAHEATLQDVAAVVMAAGELKATKVRAVAVFAGQIAGDVKTVFTPVTAFLAGAGFALTLFGLRRLFGRMRRPINPPRKG